MDNTVDTGSLLLGSGEPAAPLCAPGAALVADQGLIVRG